MIVLLHVAIALSSIAYSSYLLINPSKTRFYKSYVLVASTLVSGAYLAATTQTHLVQTCMTGLIYIGFVAVATGLARKRLTSAKAGDSKSE